MVQKSYEANLETALSYLKNDQRKDAVSTMKRALSQVPEDEKLPENLAYLKILFFCARFAIEDTDERIAYYYIKEGIKTKKFYADFLFLDIFLAKLQHRYGDMLSSIIAYLISIDLPDRDAYGYDFVNTDAINEVFTVYLPLAYNNTQNHAMILNVLNNTIEKVKEFSTGENVSKAYDIMRAMDFKSN
ncbi:MAG: hypothetical protein HQK88_04710 [Nitrospirae bacterium]|nr:hypothetical protein [Nitrospirota bacterium]MBF0533369.1 hypothetical protein [Nitrospirota bacterium]MBF0616105.1 hypothetical protein [Nitrospirota bacterium]